MTAKNDALQLLIAEREDEQATVTSLIAGCDKDAVIRLLLDHFYGIDDAYFVETKAEGVLDEYLDTVRQNDGSIIPKVDLTRS